MAGTQAARRRTLYDKLFDQHIAVRKEDGTVLLYIDRHLIHEVSSPQAFAGIKAQGRRIRRPDLSLATCDHGVPTTPAPRIVRNAQTRLQVDTLAANVALHSIPYLGLSTRSQGIVHVVGPELGFTLPGTTVVCGDSHTSTHGALGCLAFGIGTSEVEHVLATQTVATRKWKNMRIWIEGHLGEGIGSKDLALFVIGAIGTAAGTGAALEFAGPTIEALHMEARMSLCNMAIEAGARAGMIAPDTVTFDYLKGKPLVPDGADWNAALSSWRSYHSDPGAYFDAEWVFNAADVAPMVSWGTSPEQVISITSSIPLPTDFADPAKSNSCAQALKYMGLDPGTPMTEIAIDKVFIGSCTNARLSDLRSAASVLKGRKVSHSLVAAYCVPGSGIVKQQAEAEGLDKVFLDAGFEWREAGCSLCVGLNEDNLDPYERSASTSNRNFENRQGTASRTHLMSPAMAAAAAIKGFLADAREFTRSSSGSLDLIPAYPDQIDELPEWSNETDSPLASQDPIDDTIANGPFKTLTSLAAPFDRMNTDTDCILPKQFCTTIHRRGLRDGLFHNLRFTPLGALDPTFVLCQPPYDKPGEAKILLCKQPNFGCGSSREHAVWALLDYGFHIVLAPSFADIFYNNSFKNGLLPAKVPQEIVSVLEAESRALRPLTVDLEAQEVRSVAGVILTRFDVDERGKNMLLEGKDEIGVNLQYTTEIEAYERLRTQRWPWLDECVAKGWRKLKLKSGGISGLERAELSSIRREDLAW